MLILMLLAIGVCYLIGSFCSAIFVSKIFHLPDPREEGSQNPGATNVLRLSGKKYAVIVLLTDMLKGFLPVFAGYLSEFPPFILGLMGLAAVLGHIFPVFYKFKGGKGVATALGVLIGINVTIGLMCCLIWLITVKISRYASLASLVALAATPILIILSSNRGATLPVIIMAALIIYKHRDNIVRLKNNEESMIKF